MNAFAKAGATARLAELQQEIASLHAAFPDLNGAARSSKQRRAPKQSVAEVPLPRTRKGMSAAAKKAVGERMRAYWAKRKGTASAPTVPAAANATTEHKPAAKPAAKRTLSAEGRARISAAAKKRWKAQRKAKSAA